MTNATTPATPSKPSRFLPLWLSFKGIYWLTASALTAGIIILLLTMVVTSPPRKMVIASGPEGSYFEQTARKYAFELRKQGIEVEILNTAGAEENVQLINDETHQVDIAFIHGGVTNTQESPRLMSLGSIGYEPVWIFYRSGLGKLSTLNQLKGLRIATGRSGSGIDLISRKFLKALGIDESNSRIQSLSEDEVARRLVAGQVDAAFFMDPPETSKIHHLFELKGIEIMPLTQAEAMRRNFQFLHVLEIPRSTIDLARIYPSQDIQIMATTAVVVARKETHSAIVYLLMSIIDAVHEPPTLLSKENEFPADKDVDLPISPQAEHYFRGGKPFLQRYLPFWVASAAERFLAVGLPLLALLFPFLNIAPRVYNWRIKARITRCYQDLIELERRVKLAPKDHLHHEFERLVLTVDEYLNEKKVPISYSNEIYILKEHIELVRRKIEV
jgi:TRAP transporter TAXI family solute receptor